MRGTELLDKMELIDPRYVEAADIAQKKRIGVSIKRLVIAACLVTALSMGTVVLSATMGCDPLGWIIAAFTKEGGSPNPAIIQEQIEQGQWIYLNDNNLALILPESPTKILLSTDGGETWRESVVDGSDKMLLFGDVRENISPDGGFIGFFGEGGYLVLTSPVSMGNQPMRIYLTDDSGETWVEISSPYDTGAHYCVVTGAGFSTEKIGFISYRYYEDAGPDIWWTYDGGNTWEELSVVIPEKYAGRGYVFTPRSPSFHDAEGIYPIEVRNRSDNSCEIIYMYSDDYGITWQFR